jgi:hypothetical protein
MKGNTMVLLVLSLAVGLVTFQPAQAFPWHEVFDTYNDMPIDGDWDGSGGGGNCLSPATITCSYIIQAPDGNLILINGSQIDCRSGGTGCNPSDCN